MFPRLHSTSNKVTPQRSTAHSILFYFMDIDSLFKVPYFTSLMIQMQPNFSGSEASCWGEQEKDA